MAAINDLISQIENPELRQRIQQEVAKMAKQKKFGLVFEEHLPENTPLYDLPIKKGIRVAKRDGDIKDNYRVIEINDGVAECEHLDDKHERFTFPIDDIIAVAQFGEPIYPYLKLIDSICNAPNSELWHTLIQADNYHALQLLVYLYGGMVDCIYIDPPYNTGARDWKYNNDYVDDSDSFRHSKWLSMMKKRLVLAKKLLNPKNSVLIVTIDEKEYLRLGCLLEEIFPEATKQMVTTVINPKGRATDYFTRTDEYIFFLFLGNAKVIPFEKESGIIEVRWPYLKRSDTDSTRGHRPRQFYPIYINDETGKIQLIGEPISSDIDRNSVPQIDGCTAVFPVNEDGTEMEWGLTAEPLKKINKQGFVRIGKKRIDNPMPYAISYLSTADVKRVEKGILKIVGEREDGTKIVVSESGKQTRMQTVWTSGLYDAGAYGKTIVNNIIPKHPFPYPKSLYAVHDTIRFFVANKPNALVVDFFAGSGTTLHAVNLLNAEDGGNRRCVMVTNNEVSEEEENRLKNEGLHPGEDEWEKWGIARYVNWPRTKCSILGLDVNGKPINGSYQTYLKQEKEKERTIKQITLIDDPSSLKTAQKKELVALCCQGKLPQSLVKADTKFIVSEDHPCSILFDINYSEEWFEVLEGQDQITEFYILTQDIEAFNKLKADILELLGKIVEEEPVLRPMADGFYSNANFFKLGFLDKTNVALGRQFKELLPLLWMKAGAKGECPRLETEQLPKMLICKKNHFAVLIDEKAYAQFVEEVNQLGDIQMVYLVVDSDSMYREMAKGFSRLKTCQLYRDYLDNFRINITR